MSSKNRRYDPLADVLRRFVRRHSVRVLAVEASRDDQQDVARLVSGFEHHADNRSPFFAVRVTESARAAAAWTEVLKRVQDIHSELRSAGAPVGDLPAQPVGGEPAANASFVLAGIAGRVEAPAEGLLVCLELAGDLDPAVLDHLGTMARSREAELVRFVVIAQPSAGLEPWSARLRTERAWFYRLEPASDAQATRAVQALDAEEQNGPGFRGAWPTGAKPPPRPRRRRRSAFGSPEVPPTRVSEAQPAEDEAETEFEHELSLLIRRAEAEMQQERGPEALRFQTRARELCTEHEQHVRAIEMEMMLGGYLLRLEQPRLAASTFARADASGFEHQAYEHAAKAQLNQGIAFEADGDTVESLKAYRRAIETGKGVADAPAVVFDAYRRAGETALREGLDVDCIGLWADAVAYARDLEASRRGDGIKDLAKRLSELLVRHRRYSQAREIDRIAEEF